MRKSMKPKRWEEYALKKCSERWTKLSSITFIIDCAFLLNMTDSYEKIVPTAWLVAYRRKYSDIPFSTEIFFELDKLRSERFFDITDRMLRPELSPQYEARHKIIDKYILANGLKQILEIASGFSSRGISMSKNPAITYVEFDLPRVMQDKTRIAQSILASIGEKRNNLYFESGNALDYASLQKAVRHFRKEPITIINEGLLRYMTFDEKEGVARNIHRLLETYGGCWITSDITLKKLLKVEDDINIHNKTIAKMTGIDVDKNRFENEEQAQQFFKDRGFSIERHSFMEVKEQLVSPQELKLSETEVDKLLDSAVVYVMRVK